MTREIIMNELKNRGYGVEAHDVIKNGVELQGIVIGQGNIRPTIYVNDYLGNDNLDEVVNSIINVLGEAEKTHISFDIDLFDWEKVKNRLQLCIQRKGKEDILKRDFLDLEQYIRVIVNTNRDGQASFKLMPRHLEAFGVSEEVVFNAALECTKSTLVKEDIFEVMARMAGVSKQEIMSNMPGPHLIVLSNKQKINGAVAMCYMDFLSEIANEYESDIVILPSSIHEVIVVPVDEKTDFSELDIMVQSVNKSELLPEEQLSDHAYRFNRNTAEITYCC